MTINDFFDKSWVDMIGAGHLAWHIKRVDVRLATERKEYKVLPPIGDPGTFKAFRTTPFNEVKVVILGQDPYHDPGRFNGYAFGNNIVEGKPLSPSLRSIMKEVERTHGALPDPSLEAWAQQGVLLINTAHTVRAGDPGSHLKLWQPFTSAVIAALNDKDNVVWMLWGGKAQAFEPQILNETHHILKAGHPSPLNRANPFVGSDIFKRCDDILGDDKINWTYGNEKNTKDGSEKPA